MKRKFWSSGMRTHCSHFYLNSCLLIAARSIKIEAGVFLGKCVRTATKTIGCGHTKKKDTISAIFGVAGPLETQALYRPSS